MNWKVILFVIAGVVVVTIVSVVTIIFVTNKIDNVDGDNSTENKNYDIEIICDEEIKINIDDEPIKLVYEIKNIYNIDYTLKIEVDNTNIEINNDYIKPLNVGTSKITISVYTKTQIFSKIIKVEVVKSFSSATLKILNINKQEVDKVFVSENYYLEITLNEIIEEEFSLFTSENISNLSIEEKTNTKLTFSFYVSSYQETIFEFVYKNYSNKICLNCYEYINDFEVTFSNCFNNNTLNLFIFNENYTDVANNDNYYSFSQLFIDVNENCLNDYIVSVDNCEVADIVDNKIVAKKNGSCILKVIANDGSNYCEEYSIVVDIVKVNNVDIIFDNDDIYVGDKVTINFAFSPIYALCDLYLYSDNNFIIDKNTITPLKSGHYVLYVKDNLSNYIRSFEIDVKEHLSYYFELQINESFLTENNATFIDNVLTINNNSEHVIIPMSYICVVENNPDIDIDCNIDLICSNEINCSYVSYSNAVIFEIYGTGEIDVKLSLIENSEIYCSFKIIII